MDKVKPALIITNKNKEDLLSQQKITENNKNIVIFSTFGIVESCQDMMKKKCPFKIYINTGNKKIEFFYEVIDFISLMGGKGIQCPKEWVNYIYLTDIISFEKLKNNNFQFNPYKNNFEPIKTWFLINKLKKIETPIIWENLSTISGSRLYIPNRIGFMYINDPLE